ncbi:hypothetical protein GCM10011490_19560 [Pseudoclavibacter endophyticus]|uniref:conjugal transfer protein n=1 Tax=Pseudoclavibacter endophyticus TaxID=1778590 RepID=UPI0016666FD4|nr:conjugal transfer protein [Pseudoclavibacter endophyticus]GGA69094.1 hypothetical protein GCM10011490_19560 [Pseudoclavibacter endophyticus]
MAPDEVTPPESGLDEHASHGDPGGRRRPVRAASDWTAGRALAGRGVSILLWAAIACGPIALVASALAPGPSLPEAEAQAASQVEPTLSAEALAVMLVGAWLSATVDAPEPFATLLPGATIEATVPTGYRDLAVAATEGPDASGVVAVIVAGLVDESAPPEHDSAAADVVVPGAVWVPRSFQVSVATADGLSALGEPAAVALPPAANPPTPPPHQLAVSTEAGTAAAMFLAAYLTSSPDLERFTAPEAGIVPLAGAPYVSASVRDLRTNEQPASPPAPGDVLHVRATVVAVNRGESSQTLTYWLVLTARDGRWEASAIAPGPPEASTDDDHR